MSVGRKKLNTFAQRALTQGASPEWIKRHINTLGLPSIYKLSLERDLWMSQFRRGLAQHLKTPTAILDARQLRSKGRHWFADFIISESKKAKLLQGDNPAKTIEELVVAAARIAKATIINHMSFQHTAKGHIVGAVVIQESHLSVHVIPEENYVAVDVFTCGEIDFQGAIDFIGRRLGSTPFAKLEILRGITRNDCFIPGIGVQIDDEIQMLNPNDEGFNQEHALGRHLIVELYLCNPMTVTDAEWIKQVFRTAIIKSRGNCEADVVYQFEPQGASDAIIGSFSEDGVFVKTIHTYPEWRSEHGGAYAAMDICDFSQRLDFEKLGEYIQAELKSEKTVMYCFSRGAYNLRLGKHKDFIDGLSFPVDSLLEQSLEDAGLGLRLW